MVSKTLAAALLGSALMAAPALAQSSNQSATAAGLWQGSKLISMNVYNDQNEKIGDIKELMVDKNGKIESAVIGVGGFLSMGERDVAVKFSDLKWVDAPVASTASTTTTTTTNRPATTGSNTMAPATRTDAPATTTKKTYPDHAVFNATKDQLKAMPQFDYNK
jgi:sporulation protein YlmC with PRC-barrel domain